ncbi:MAG: DUF4468 domain-containing protein [Chitinispirillaceae bacterium]|nr:DUF4468 domain-containing protein [Chitinispirillaceae bacterium]
MRRFAAAALVAGLFGGCAGTYENIPAEQARFEMTYKTALSKDEVFDISMRWIDRTFASAKEVIEYKDKTAGKIIGNGRTTFTAGTGIAEIPVTFKMEISIKKGAFRLVMDELTAFWGIHRDMPRPIEGPVDLELVSARLTALCESLNTEINRRDDGW